jgi:hypothetical protein
VFTDCALQNGAYLSSDSTFGEIDMAPKHLSVVPGEPKAAERSEVYDLGRGPDTVADRVKRLQEEAKLLAREEIEAFENRLTAAAEMALTIAKGGDAYPVGVRAMAEQLSEELPLRVQGLKALMERISR